MRKLIVSSRDFANSPKKILIPNLSHLIKEKFSTISFLWLSQLYSSTVPLSDVQNVCSACLNTYKSSEYRFAVWKKTHKSDQTSDMRAASFGILFERENMTPRYHFTPGLWPSIVERWWPSTTVTVFSVPLTDALSHCKPYHLHQWIQ